MKNILCNPQSARLKHFIKVVRISFSSMSLKCSANSLTGCQTLSTRESERKKDVLLLKGNVKSLSTSVRYLENTDGGTCKEKENTSIIYNGSLAHRVKGVKIFTIVTSIGGVALQPWLLETILKGHHVSLGMGLLTCLGFFTYITPFLCHFITKKYVTEIRYNSTTDTYTATVLSFFIRDIRINFKIEDIMVPSVPPMFSTMYIKGRPVFIIADCFVEIEHYIKMMGYDKPMDLKVNATTDSVDNTQNKEKSKIM